MDGTVGDAVVGMAVGIDVGTAVGAYLQPVPLVHACVRPSTTIEMWLGEDGEKKLVSHKDEHESR